MKNRMPDEADYILDLNSQSAGASADEQPAAPDPIGAPADAVRPWIGVQFDCCGIYVRVYRNREGTAYVGRCPRCLREARVRVGSGGTEHRLFRAT